MVNRSVVKITGDGGAALEENLTFYLEKVVHAPQEVMEDFEGPLDLILFLLTKNKIEIEDLQISLICKQFIAWIEARQSLDMEVASDFILMASHLVYLKSKKLLAAGDAQDEEIDLLKLALEERMLREERQKLESARNFLASRAELYRLIIAKPPELLERDKTYTHFHGTDELKRAMLSLFERSERRVPPPPEAFSGIVGREPYPVEDKMDEIRSLLLRHGKLMFESVILGAGKRSEKIATFLAILEMCRAEELDLEESGGSWFIRMTDMDNIQHS